MKTVSSIVENYIKTKPFLLNALSLGIINLTSLSRNIMTELESEFGKGTAFTLTFPNSIKETEDN